MKNIRKILATIGLLLMPTLAFAQAVPSNIFTPVSGDKSMQILDALFGKIGVFGGMSGSDAFFSIITVLNAAALTIGGILVAYTIIVGTANTAHDGEMLGKKFSSVWVPIRTAMGSALVLPVIKGSYCLMQLIVAWLVVQGIGLADQAWSAYTSSANLTQSVSVGLQQPNVSTLGYNVFESLVCMNKLASPQTEAEQVAIANSKFGITTQDNLTNIKYLFGDKNQASGLSLDSCGSVTVPLYHMPTLGPSTGSAISGLFNVGQSIARTKTLVDDQNRDTITLIKTLQPVAQKFVQTNQLDSASIDSAISAYEAQIRQDAANLTSQMSPYQDISKYAAQDGWISEGNYYMKLASLSNMINNSMLDVPSSIGPTKALSSPLWGNQISTTIRPLISQLNAQNKGVATFGIANQDGGSSSGWLSTIAKTVTSGFDFNIIMKKIFTSSFNFVIDPTQNPVITASNMGHWLLGIGSAAFGVGITLMATVGNAPGVGLAIATVMLSVVPMMLMTGILLSYIIPMMPFFIFLGAFIGWLIMVVEAMIAAPLWAVMHLHPSGDDVTGKGGNGYYLVLSLLIRPLLMTFGFVAALTIIQVLGQYYNEIFADVFVSTQTNSNFLILILGMILSGFFYGGGVYILIKRSFALIHEVPDNMLEWFSSSSSRLGSSANQVGSVDTFAAANVAGSHLANQAATLGTGMKGNAIAADSNKTLKEGNELQKEIAEQNQNSELNKELGDGAASVVNDSKNPASSGGGSSTGYNSQSKANQLRGVMSALGGKDSPLYKEFSKNMSDNAKGNGTFSDNVAASINSTLDGNFGDKTSNVANLLSNKMSDSKMAGGLVQSYNDVKSSLEAKGMPDSQIKDTISNMNQNIINDLNNGKMDSSNIEKLNQYFDKAKNGA